MASRTAHFCIDAADPVAQARWWSQVLDDFQITADSVLDDEEAELHGPGGRLLVFLKVPEPKTVKNRMHICLRPASATHDAEIDRIVALGARVVDDRRGLDDGDWVVFADPEGNEFCLLPTPAEQAGVSRT